MSYSVINNNDNFGSKLQQFSKDMGHIVPEIAEHYKEYVNNKNYMRDVKSETASLLDNLKTNVDFKNAMLNNNHFETEKDYYDWLDNKKNEVLNAKGKNDTGNAATKALVEVTSLGNGYLGDGWLARSAVIGGRIGSLEDMANAKKLIDINDTKAKEISDKKQRKEQADKQDLYAKNIYSLIKEGNLTDSKDDILVKAREVGIDTDTFEKTYEPLLSKYESVYNDEQSKADLNKYTVYTGKILKAINETTDPDNIDPYSIYNTTLFKTDEAHAKTAFEAAKDKQDRLDAAVEAQRDADQNAKELKYKYAQLAVRRASQRGKAQGVKDPQQYKEMALASLYTKQQEADNEIAYYENLLKNSNDNNVKAKASAELSKWKNTKKAYEQAVAQVSATPADEFNSKERVDLIKNKTLQRGQRALELAKIIEAATTGKHKLVSKEYRFKGKGDNAEVFINKQWVPVSQLEEEYNNLTLPFSSNTQGDNTNTNSTETANSDTTTSGEVEDFFNQL